MKWQVKKEVEARIKRKLHKFLWEYGFIHEFHQIVITELDCTGNKHNGTANF
jgi:hypothetical protein